MIHQRTAPRRGRRIAARLGAIGTGAALLCGVALAPAALAASVAGQAYTDVGSGAEAAAITFLTTSGVLNGYPDHTFKPGNTITRAEFAAAVVRLLGPTAAASAGALANITPSFPDGTAIPTWAWGYVNYAQGQKLIEGFPDGTFQANAQITMVQAAAILIRAIGDDPSVTGTWPANYTIAAYNLKLDTGLQFNPNVPATRGDVAQLTYDAALLAPTLQNGYTSGTPTGTPLYLGGDGMKQSAWMGTVSGVTTSTIALNNAQGQPELSAGLADTYFLIGGGDVTTLQGEQVTVAENAQGQVAFIQVTAGQGTHQATLAAGSVGTHAGYTRINDWTVTNSAGASLVLSDGTLVPLVSQNSGGGTNYYLNASSAGVAADTHALVAGTGNLAAGDAVTYVLDTSGRAITVYAVGATIPLGVVTGINTNNNTVAYSTGSNDATSGTASVQPWTAVRLGGASSTLANLQIGDVVSVALVGGGSSDNSASTILATRQTVSGTISSITTQSNGSTTVTTIGVTASGGQTTTVTEDSSFDNRGVALNIGAAVTLVLDAQGQARQAVAAVGQQTVVLVEGTQQSTRQASNGSIQTVDQIVVDNGGQKLTYDLANTNAMPAQPGPTGYLAVLTFLPGSTTVSSVAQLGRADANNTLKVLSNDGTTIAVQEYNANGQPTQTAYVVLSGNGAVAYHGLAFVAYGNVPLGQTVTVWQAQSGVILGILY